MANAGFFALEGLDPEALAAVVGAVTGIMDLAVLRGARERENSPVPGKSYKHLDTMVKAAQLASTAVTIYFARLAWELQRERPTPVFRWLSFAGTASLLAALIKTDILFFHTEAGSPAEKNPAIGDAIV